MSREHEVKEIATGSADPSQHGLSPGLTTRDLSSYLLAQGRVLENPVTGNPSVAAALIRLSKILGRYSSHDLDEVLSGLSLATGRREARKHGPASQLEGVDVASLDLKIVEEMLRNQALTKGDIVRLGSVRFGIPGSKLERQNRADAMEEIQAALRNTEALDVISQEATREGGRRSS